MNGWWTKMKRRAYIALRMRTKFHFRFSSYYTIARRERKIRPPLTQLWLRNSPHVERALVSHNARIIIINSFLIRAIVRRVDTMHPIPMYKISLSWHQILFFFFVLSLVILYSFIVRWCDGARLPSKIHSIPTPLAADDDVICACEVWWWKLSARAW